jgi:hypothetical protein
VEEGRGGLRASDADREQAIEVLEQARLMDIRVGAALCFALSRKCVNRPNEFRMSRYLLTRWCWPTAATCWPTTRPPGLMLTAVLHFVSDESDPRALVRRYLDALAPGSYLSLSHMTNDNKPPQAVQVADSSFHRTKDQVRGFFDGLRLVPPYPGAELDVTWVGLWGCEDPVQADSEGSRWLYRGVAVK